MTIDQFVNKYNGRPWDFDKLYREQCVDLFNFYNRDVVGAKFIPTPKSGGARDLWEVTSAERDKHYVKVDRNRTPQKGDVAVYSGQMPGTGGYGHVDIVLNATGNKLRVIGQNYNQRFNTTVVTHGKEYLLGYLRPRKFLPKKVVKPTPRPVFYTVRSGDYLSKIATKFKTTWQRIWKLNPKIKNPNKINVGDKLRIK